MKKLLINNWVLKLFSVIAAALLWLMVTNDNNPLVSYTLYNVPVEIVNDEVFSDNNLVYRVTAGSTVNIEVQVRQTVARQLRTSDFHLQADCTNWHPGIPTIPIEAEVVNNRSYYQDGGYQLSSTVVKIEVEELKTVTMDVEIEAVGEVASGYTLGSLTCSPEQVEVNAPESVADILSRAVVYINVSDAMGDVQETCNLILYDGNDTAIVPEESDVTLSADTVNVTAEVLNTKRVPVVVTNVTGQPADGYRYTETTCSVESVEIAGPRAVVSNVTAVILDSDLLDVTGATDNVHVTLDITDFLPADVSLVGMESSQVDIEMAVEPLAEKTFTVNADDIQILNQTEGLEYSLQDMPIQITVRGLREDLDTLELESLSLSADMAGMGIGTHEISVSMTLGDAYEVMDPVTVTVEIAAAEAETESQESTEEESEESSEE